MFKMDNITRNNAILNRSVHGQKYKDIDAKCTGHYF